MIIWKLFYFFPLKIIADQLSENSLHGDEDNYMLAVECSTIPKVHALKLTGERFKRQKVWSTTLKTPFKCPCDKNAHVHISEICKTLHNKKLNSLNYFCYRVLITLVDSTVNFSEVNVISQKNPISSKNFVRN